MLVKGGFEALRRRSAKVPTPKLTAEQLAQIPNLALSGNRSPQLSRPGLDDQARGGSHLADFAVSYLPAQVSRLLRSMDLRVQEPIKRAAKRDERAIWRWCDEQRLALKTSAAGVSDRAI